MYQSLLQDASESLDSAAGPEAADVCIFGMGYVGLTLAMILADKGMRVIGYEAHADICHLLNQGQVQFQEKGLKEALARHLNVRLKIVEAVSHKLPPVVIVCVGTPIHEETKTPDLSQLESVLVSLGEYISSSTLLLIRSTVPIGTCRRLAATLRSRGCDEPLLAYCPERSIQGKTLEEVRTLPQIIGGLNPLATERAKEFFSRIVREVVTVSSLEAAEAIKLLCNAHTDLLYCFGNEVALMAHAVGLDANELISAANLNYPRPDLAMPGFVGGTCLSKDPYLLIHSLRPYQHSPTLVPAARRLNESMPLWAGKRVLTELERMGRDLSRAKIFISGFAYKGEPETDDIRGAPCVPLVELFLGQAKSVVGHDFVVPSEKIAVLGVEPVCLEEGFAQADLVMLLNNHSKYRTLEIGKLVESMNRPAVVFDAWGIFRDRRHLLPSGIRYLGLGYE